MNKHLFAELEKYFTVYPSDEIMEAIKQAIENDKAEADSGKAKDEVPPLTIDQKRALFFEAQKAQTQQMCVKKCDWIETVYGSCCKKCGTPVPF